MRLKKGDHVAGFVCSADGCGEVVPLSPDDSRGTIAPGRLIPPITFSLRCPTCGDTREYHSDDMRALVLDTDADVP